MKLSDKKSFKKELNLVMKLQVWVRYIDLFWLQVYESSGSNIMYDAIEWKEPVGSRGMAYTLVITNFSSSSDEGRVYLIKDWEIAA